MWNFQSLFAKYSHSDNQNVSNVSDDNWYVISRGEENFYFLPGHILEANSEVTKEVVDYHKLDVI
jgi:hypothetical protein